MKDIFADTTEEQSTSQLEAQLPFARPNEPDGDQTKKIYERR